MVVVLVGFEVVVCLFSGFLVDLVAGVVTFIVVDLIVVVFGLTVVVDFVVALVGFTDDFGLAGGFFVVIFFVVGVFFVVVVFFVGLVFFAGFFVVVVLGFAVVYYINIEFTNRNTENLNCFPKELAFFKREQLPKIFTTI